MSSSPNSRLAFQWSVTVRQSQETKRVGVVPDRVFALEHRTTGARVVFFVEADRATAIRRAVLEASESDVILLAGKGHETYQEIAGVRTPFSDLEQAQLALALRRSNLKEIAA